MAKKVKTHFMASWRGHTNAPYFVGVDGTQYSPDAYTEMCSNPAAFEVVESFVGLQMHAEMRESLGPGWVNTNKPRTGFREVELNANQQLQATVHSLKLRHFAAPSSASSAGEGTWKRGSVSVLVAPDGSWKCGTSSGKDAHHLDTTLDSQFPESAREVAQRSEANRHRVERAYSLLGLSADECKIAADTEEEITLAECWAQLCGSEEAAAIAMGADREPRQLFCNTTIKTLKETRGNSR